MNSEVTQCLVSYTDLRGVQRAKLIPRHSFNSAEENGVGFAGFASWLTLEPSDADVIAKPDFSKAIQLPWRQNTLWAPADLYINEVVLEQNPRQILKKALAKAQKENIIVKTGVEAEFMLVKDPSLDSQTLRLQGFDQTDFQEKPCYDQQILYRNLEFIEMLVEYLNELGWGCYQADHEDANNQYEINWSYCDALTTADRHSFFKFMVKSLAPKFGAKATFMPKPFENLTGNGCHCHVSCWSADTDQNLFINEKNDGNSFFYEEFASSLVQNLEALSLLTNPTVNSYRRLHSATPRSGSTWTPTEIKVGGNDRTVMIRQPDKDRIENRIPDGSANPYLLQVAMVAGGLAPRVFNLANDYSNKKIVIPKNQRLLRNSSMRVLEKHSSERSKTNGMIILTTSVGGKSTVT
jgi:glutamine synthetase